MQCTIKGERYGSFVAADDPLAQAFKARALASLDADQTVAVKSAKAGKP